jgi:hypothetical protein
MKPVADNHPRRKSVAPIWKNQTARWLFVLAFVPIPLSVFLAVGLLPILGSVSARSEAPPDVRDSSRPDAIAVEEALLRARLDAAGEKAIAFWIDLRDSLAQTEYRGVPLRRSPIRGYRISRLLLKRAERLQVWTVASSVSTIALEPIRLHRAPLDTLDAARNPIYLAREEPDARFRFRTTEGFTLVVTQAPTSVSEWLRARVFDLKGRFAAVLKDARALAAGRLPVHEPGLEIRLDEADARAMYRSHREGTTLILVY